MMMQPDLAQLLDNRRRFVELYPMTHASIVLDALTEAGVPLAQATRHARAFVGQLVDTALAFARLTLCSPDEPEHVQWVEALVERVASEFGKSGWESTAADLEARLLAEYASWSEPTTSRHPS